MYDFIQHRAVLDSLGVGTKDPPPESGAVDVGNPSFGVGWEEELGCAGAKVTDDGFVAAFTEAGSGVDGAAGEAVGVDDGQREGRRGEDG